MCVIIMHRVFWRQINIHNEKCINWNEAEIREFLTIRAEADIPQQFSEMSRVFTGSLCVNARTDSGKSLAV